jgi:hypothetical protein
MGDSDDEGRGGAAPDVPSGPIMVSLKSDDITTITIVKRSTSFYFYFLGTSVSNVGIYSREAEAFRLRK